jgi:hypothetical protein
MRKLSIPLQLKIVMQPGSQYYGIWWAKADALTDWDL